MFLPNLITSGMAATLANVTISQQQVEATTSLPPAPLIALLSSPELPSLNMHSSLPHSSLKLHGCRFLPFSRLTFCCVCDQIIHRPDSQLLLTAASQWSSSLSPSTLALVHDDHISAKLFFFFSLINLVCSQELSQSKVLHCVLALSNSKEGKHKPRSVYPTFRIRQHLTSPQHLTQILLVRHKKDGWQYLGCKKDRFYLDCSLSTG